MLTAEQLAQRRTGIGSSDIAAIADLDPHRGPIDVYLDKLGLAHGSVETTWKWCGDRLEHAIAGLYQERTGAKLVRSSKTRRHKAVPIALATADRLVRHGEADLVEIKNVGGWMALGWGDGPPVAKVLQVQWQLEVYDLDLGHIAALLGGTTFEIFPVRRDRELAAELLELAAMFWEEHVLAQVPPPHDGEAARRLAAIRWPRSTDRMLPSTPEAEELRDRLLRVKRHAKRVKSLEQHLEARAMVMIGDADGIEDCFTWKHSKAGEPSEENGEEGGAGGRRFLVKKPKERGRKA